MKNISISILMLILITNSISAFDAPSMWMEQDGKYVNIKVNTSESSMGSNVKVYFDQLCINIVTVDFLDSPWQPLSGDGWSKQGDHIVLAGINFTGVDPGKYQIARFEIECLNNCTSELRIEQGEPIGVEIENATYICKGGVKNSIISIGSGSGSCIIPIYLKNFSNVGSCDVLLEYDHAVINISGVYVNAMDNYSISQLSTDIGEVRIVAYQTETPGIPVNFILANISFVPVDPHQSCELSLSVKTIKDATNNTNPFEFITQNGMYYASETPKRQSNSRDGTYPSESTNIQMVQLSTSTSKENKTDEITVDNFTQKNEIINIKLPIEVTKKLFDYNIVLMILLCLTGIIFMINQIRIKR